MARSRTIDLTTAGKRFTLALLPLFFLSMVSRTPVLAQSRLRTQEGFTVIDKQIEAGKYVIPNSFFGMHMNFVNTPWPTAYFANERLEGSDVNWWNIEVAPGVYDYYWLDQWLAHAQAHNVAVMYTFVGVPQFYSSIPNDKRCTYQMGACDPPKDLNEDGTGTDGAFQNFVRDIVKHNAELGSPIQYWETWNEPNIVRQWIPTCENKGNQCTGNLKYAQILRMATDAYAIIKQANPNAVVLTPSPVGMGGAAKWMNGYLAALQQQNGPYPDIVGFHGYTNKWVMGYFPSPENEVTLVKQLKQVAQQFGLGSKPMWITEGSWGNTVLDGFIDGVPQAAFLARFIVLQESLGISQAYWYQWENPAGDGTLWEGPSGSGDWNLSGYAYNSVVNWTMGATLSHACTQQSGDSWVCKYSRSDPEDYQAEIVWNAKRSSTYTVPEGLKQYCDLKGNVTPIKGKTVSIGIWPILLENKDLGQSACEQQTSLLPVTAQLGISNVLGRDIRDYHVQPVDGVLNTTNPHQNLAVRFVPSGVEIRHGSARWKMSLRGWGYGDALAELNAVTPQASSNRVEYRHDSFTEWYVNGPVGLEQGFTLHQAPGKPNGQPLTIALRLSGDLTPTLGSDKKDLLLTDQKRAVLSYTGLRAYDADGKELSASLELHRQELRLRVVDKGARYPVMIDPITQVARLTASHSLVGDQLGFSIALNHAGNVAVVGAPHASGKNSHDANTGVAYVFASPAKGWRNMVETAELTASDGVTGEQFGASVAIDGKTVVVGAPYAPIGSNPRQGAAYVFVQPAGGWKDSTETAKLGTSDGNLGDEFGSSVAVSGNTAIAGAPFATVNNNYAQGAAYLYIEPSGGWTRMTQTSKFTTSTGTVWDNLGQSVAIAANTAVVGSPYGQLAPNQLNGAAYVFVEPTGGWPADMTPTAQLLASDGGTGDEFGFVSISGDDSTIVVGAPWNDASTTGPLQGAAYVFARPANGWVNMTQTAKLIATDGHQPDYLGNAVAVSSDNSTIVLGAPNYTLLSKRLISQGAAYVFFKPTGGWANSSEPASTTGGKRGYFFANGVGVNTGSMAAGAQGADYSHGAGYVFSVSP